MLLIIHLSYFWRDNKLMFGCVNYTEYSTRWDTWAERNTMVLKQASMFGLHKFRTNTNLVYLRFGLSLVPLAMISTPLKLVGRWVQSSMEIITQDSLLTGLTMHIKQQVATISCVPVLSKPIVRLRLELPSLPRLHTRVDNSILLCLFGRYNITELSNL